MDTRSGQILPLDEVEKLPFEDRQHFVPVSDQVAKQQLIGQRVEARRLKRKAVKAARKKNRGN